MVTVIYRDGRRADFSFENAPPEYHLAVACYADDLVGVRAALEANPSIDVNAAVIRSPTRGNGTPLVLTGCVEIAKLLVGKGADVNHSYFNGRDFVTPLASAEKEMTKLPVRTDPDRLSRVEALVDYLRTVGASAS